MPTTSGRGSERGEQNEFDFPTDSEKDGFDIVDDFAQFIVKLYLDECRQQ